MTGKSTFLLILCTLISLGDVLAGKVEFSISKTTENIGQICRMAPSQAWELAKELDEYLGASAPVRVENTRLPHKQDHPGPE